MIPDTYDILLLAFESMPLDDSKRGSSQAAYRSLPKNASAGN